jgi:hypothetical protein
MIRCRAQLALVVLFATVVSCKGKNHSHRRDVRPIQRNPLEQLVFPVPLHELVNVTRRSLERVSGTAVSRSEEGAVVVLTSAPQKTGGSLSLHWTARLTPAPVGGTYLMVMKTGVMAGEGDSAPTEALVRDGNQEFQILQLIDPDLAARVAQEMARDDHHGGVQR